MKTILCIRNVCKIVVLLTIVTFINSYSQSIDKEIAEIESYIQEREKLPPDDLAVKDSQIKPMADLDKAIQNLNTAVSRLNRMSDWIGENVEKIRNSGKTRTTVTIGDLVTLRRGEQDWSWGAIFLPNNLKKLKGAVLKQNMLLAKTNLEKRQCQISSGVSNNLDEVKLSYRDALKIYWEFLNSSYWSD